MRRLPWRGFVGHPLSIPVEIAVRLLLAVPIAMEIMVHEERSRPGDPTPWWWPMALASWEALFFPLNVPRLLGAHVLNPAIEFFGSAFLVGLARLWFFGPKLESESPTSDEA